MDNLPVVIANVQELDALCRAWLGYDSAVVERLEVEREYLLTLLALEPALREALGMPAVDENTLDILIEVAIDRLKAQDEGEGG